MPKITINPEEIEDFKTNLYEYKGNIPVRRILAYTSADQVQFANEKNAETVVTELNTLITTAQSTADTAKTKAETAQATATSAQSTASAAQTAANSASLKADATQTTANTANITANAVKAAIENASTGLAATKEIADAAKAKADTSVQLSGEQTISGVKTFSSSPIIPTPGAADNSTRAATTAFVRAVVSALVNTAPETLDTLKELADALGNDPNFATTVATQIGNVALDANFALSLAQAALPKNGGIMTSWIRWIFDNIDLDVVGNKSNDACTPVQWLDKNSNIIGALTSWYWQTNAWHDTPYNQTALIAEMRGADGEAIRSFLSLFVHRDGTTYAQFPHPRSNNYDADGVTAKALKDYAPMVLVSDTQIHIKSTGSNTANLFEGRGFSEAMPFKTLEGAVRWVNAHCIAPAAEISYVLHDNSGQIYGNYILNPAITKQIIVSDSIKRTVSIKNTTVLCGTLMFGNVDLQIADGATAGLIANAVYGPAMIRLVTGVSINGDVGSGCTVHALYDGVIMALDSSLTGSVTGMRYRAQLGGRVWVGGRGAEAIPGSAAGIKDAYSFYA